MDKKIYDAFGIRKTKKVQEALDDLWIIRGTWDVYKVPKAELDMHGFKKSEFGKEVLMAEPGGTSAPYIYNQVKKAWMIYN